jgi:hypothetical protein
MACTNNCVLNYDNAPCIPVIAQIDTSIQFSVFYPAPLDLSDGVFLFTLATDERGDCPIMTIAQGDGLEVVADTLDVDGEELSGWTISLFIPKTHGLKRRTYYGDVRQDIDADTANIVLKTVVDIVASQSRIPS